MSVLKNNAYNKVNIPSDKTETKQHNLSITRKDVGPVQVTIGEKEQKQ